MAQLKIKNFGPIREGFQNNDGFISTKDITLFIGNQGTGKSCIAKLLSTFSWLEKALFRGDITEKDITPSKLINNYCAYQNLKNYFSDLTYLHFIGDVCDIVYSEKKVTVTINKNSESYLVPQIMYVPAERNFLSAVDRPQRLKNLPAPLYTFLDELEKAENELKGNIEIPINNIRFEYQKLNKLPFIIGVDYKIRLSEASSGLQSLIPLFLVSRNLTLSIGKEVDISKKELSMDEQRRIEKEVQQVMLAPDLSSEVKKATLRTLSSKYKNNCFINIVEELEQNLYPKSQKNILFKLLEYVNHTKGNKLILTTHSPYIINYLTLAVKGKELKEKTTTTEQEKKLNEIVPIDACIGDGQLVIYELSDNGEIKELLSYDGLPSDNNFLNRSLEDTNQLFDKLLEIEEGL